MRGMNLLFIFFLSLTIISCGKEKSDRAKINLHFAKSTSSSLTPSFNCYAIFMSWAGSPSSICYDSSENAQGVASVAAGLLGSSGGDVTVEVEKGDNRRLQIIGFQSSDTSCPGDIANLTTTQMSILGQATVLYDGVHNIVEDQENISVALNTSSTTTFTNCIGSVITWDGATMNQAWNTGRWDVAQWGP